MSQCEKTMCLAAGWRVSGGKELGSAHPPPHHKLVFNWGDGYINWGCTSTMEGISPNLLGEMDFKWAVVRGHCFCEG